MSGKHIKQQGKNIFGGESFSENADAEVDSRAAAARRLWIVTELYYPEETSTGYYLTKIAEGLANDFQTKVLCGQPNYSARGTLAAKREIHRGVEIFRSFSARLDKNVIAFRIVNMLSLSVGVFFKALLKFRKSDAVLVVTTPPLLPFATAFAAAARRADYTLLIHDNYPEILIAAGKTAPDSLLVRFLDFCNRRLYKNARKIIVVGRDMGEAVEKKIGTRKSSSAESNGENKARITGNEKSKIAFIPNWAELEQVAPRPRRENSLLEQLNLIDKFVFLYAGNMGYPNDLESIAWCAERLKEDERFHFIFLGAGVKRKWLEREAAEKHLKNITILAPRPRAEQIIFLNACDVALVSLIKKMRGVSMPSRTYNILAAGKPILAMTESGSELARVIDEEAVGWCVPPAEPRQLLQKIEDIFEKRGELSAMSRRARAAALDKYSMLLAIKRYKTNLTDKCVR